MLTYAYEQAQLVSIKQAINKHARCLGEGHGFLHNRLMQEYGPSVGARPTS